MIKLILILLCFICLSVKAFGPYSTTVPHTVKPRRSSSTNGYTPTNSWYQNWLLGTGENPIHTYPYLVKANTQGFTICYPSQINAQSNYISEVLIANLVLTSRESMTSPIIDQSTVNQDYFELAAKINFGSSFDVTLVRGSASIIADFKSSTPVLRTLHAITSGSSATTRSLKFSFNNGQTWLIQSQTPISWSLTGSEVSAQSAYTGWIKISIVTSSNAEIALINSIDSLIRNARVSYSIDRNNIGNEITISVDHNSQGLFYILPHVIGMTGSNLVNGASAKGIKGTYPMVSGKTYSYKLPIYKSSDRSIAINSQEKRDKLKEALVNDVNTLKIENRDPYFGGKELARTANLIDIADLLGDEISKEKAKNTLINELDSFWFKNDSPALVYEPTWGGLVSRASVGSPEADFGQYYYNDHHFHYGYFINAAATLAKHYPSYYNSKKEYFSSLLADYAGTCDFNGKLPCAPRNKDPFLGHSYAAGLFEFADSRNQESSSEACNGYFAVRELGKALNNQTIEDLGDYLLSSEIHATKIYWQIKQPSNIYPASFAHGVVGILWETKVDYATWFGANVEFIYGIQMLPFNDITQQYLDSNWLKESRPEWSKGLQSSAIEEGWKGFLLLADALVDPNQYGLSQNIHNLKSYDNGNSRTNTLYFYYLVGGSPSNGTLITTTNPTGITSSSTGCTGIGCINNLVDNGKPDPNCGSGLLGCHSLLGSLVGCYNPLTHGCYIGGNICIKPQLPCINLAGALTPGAACYDPSMYGCTNGQLFFLGVGK